MSSQHYPLKLRVLGNNNNAVYMIEKGDFRRAIQTLSCALDQWRLCAELQELDNSFDEYFQPKCAVNIDQCIYDPKRAFPRVNDDDEDEALYIYRKAITIPEEIFQYRQASIVMSAILTFNIALAFHLCSEETYKVDLRDVRLKKAAKLYQISHNLKLTLEEPSLNIYFNLALMNNLGLICYQRHLQNQVHTTFQSVLTTLMFLVNYGWTDDYQLDGFFWNACMILNPANIAAAA
jgi:hypothetical protein